MGFGLAISFMLEEWLLFRLIPLNVYVRSAMQEITEIRVVCQVVKLLYIDGSKGHIEVFVSL